MQIWTQTYAGNVIPPLATLFSGNILLISATQIPPTLPGWPCLPFPLKNGQIFAPWPSCSRNCHSPFGHTPTFVFNIFNQWKLRREFGQQMMQQQRQHWVCLSLPTLNNGTPICFFNIFTTWLWLNSLIPNLPTIITYWHYIALTVIGVGVLQSRVVHSFPRLQLLVLLLFWQLLTVLARWQVVHRPYSCHCCPLFYHCGAYQHVLLLLARFWELLSPLPVTFVVHSANLWPSCWHLWYLITQFWWSFSTTLRHVLHHPLTILLT